MQHQKQTLGILATLFLALGIMASNVWGQNPTPFINEISPVAALPGASAFTLTVDGTGFVSGAVVNWKVGTTTTALATTFMSTTQVTASVPASLVAAAATASVTVANLNTAPLEGTSNVAFFQITDPTTGVAFSTASSPGTGNYPYSVAVGDFNGDGKLDLAVVNTDSNTVSILLGHGDGTFTQASGSPVSVGSNPVTVAVGDFNGDGKLDLAVANEVDNTVSILLGNGDGTFTAASGSPVGVGLFPVSVAVGDFNGDGKLDLAVSNACGSSSSCSSGTVSILLGNGDGTFTPASGSPGVGNFPESVAVGDFNGDGKLDLAVANEYDNTVSILLGNGDGTFNAGPTLGTGNYPYSVAVGDFNGDGKLDLAVVNTDGNTVSILLGNGDGTFSLKSSPGVSNPLSVAVGDFNGDGKMDLAVGNSYYSAVSILLGNGDGTFNPGPMPGGGFAPQSVAVGDFNGDGRLDVAAVAYDNNAVFVVVQQPAPEVGVPATLVFGNQNLGGNKTLTLIITNTGTAGLNVTGASVSGTNSADFTAALNTCSSSVSAGGNCSVNVTFTPTIVGGENATLTVADNAGTGTQTVSLTGTGVGVPTAGIAPPSLSFGSQIVNTTSAAQTVTLSNTGSAALSITSVPISGGFAETNNCGSTLAAPGTCTIGVTFTPTSTGPFSGTLTITDNSSTGSTQTVMLSGTGLAAFTITPTPSTETVYRGVLGGFILTLKSLDGFNGKVTLSCSGGPAGSYCADLPQTVNLNGTAYAVSGILFPKNSAPGTYTINFTGTSGLITAHATAEFIVK
jgi:FG-GAP-like repeat/Abnormal spindle-like microcephaly-assoc'd, ASPM-SPD-2-Hydin/FG-GAP repeat